MLTTLLAAAIVLGPVIVIHELGHFLVAKLAGIYVKTFSIGFGPKLLKVRWGETEYALSAIPLGGYVRMAGESAEDATSDAEGAAPAGSDVAAASAASSAAGSGASADAVTAADATARRVGEQALYPRDERPDADIPPHRYLRSKPIPTRLAVVTAGPLANLVLAIVVMTGVLYHEGLHVPPTNTIDVGASDSELARAGLQTNDVVVAVAGKPVANALEVARALQEQTTQPFPLQVRRAGQDTTIVLAGVRRKGEVIEFPAWGYRYDTRIGYVKKDGPAARAGLQSGDRIIAIDGQPVSYYDEIAEHVNPAIGKPLDVVWERGGTTMNATVVPEAEDVPVQDSLTETQKIGRIQIERADLVLPVTLGQAFADGSRRIWGFTTDTLRFLGLLITGRGSRDAVGGPIRIGQVAGSALRWGYSTLFMFMAFFSVNLFLLNMLPIPVLDGGHVLFLLIEAVRGEALSVRVQDLLLKIGVSALIALMGYVVLLDVWRVLQQSLQK
jgi:regulator of sigma E protease